MYYMQLTVTLVKLTFLDFKTCKTVPLSNVADSDEPVHMQEPI